MINEDLEEKLNMLIQETIMEEKNWKKIQVYFLIVRVVKKNKKRQLANKQRNKKQKQKKKKKKKKRKNKKRNKEKEKLVSKTLQHDKNEDEKVFDKHFL